MGRRKGHKLSEETKRKIGLKNSIALKGHTPWNKGRKGTGFGKNPENIYHGDPWNKGKKYLQLTGEKHPQWKGDDVGYGALHEWVNRQLGKATFCSTNIAHKSRVFVWGNISGEYKRDISDWHSLCIPCNNTDGITWQNQFDEKGHRRLTKQP